MNGSRFDPDERAFGPFEEIHPQEGPFDHVRIGLLRPGRFGLPESEDGRRQDETGSDDRFNSHNIPPG